MSIIGISGKMQSGKNTVASIIQYLIWESKFGKCEKSFEDCLPNMIFVPKGVRGFTSIANESGWKQKAFAGKLKQIVSILTGISVKDLEKQEVKDSLLPDCWQVYELYNYGELVTNRSTINKIIVSFPTEAEIRDFCDTRTNSQHQFTYKKTNRTVRWLLQTVGTDALRDVIHSNVHVNALFADYKPIGDNLLEGKVRKIREEDLIYPDWIITDLRFPNELDAIEVRNGITIRVNRPCEECGVLEGHKMIPHKNKPSEHPSETALDNAQFKHTIENSGTIEELIVKVRETLIKEKII